MTPADLTELQTLILCDEVEKRKPDIYCTSDCESYSVIVSDPEALHHKAVGVSRESVADALLAALRDWVRFNYKKGTCHG